MFDAFTELHHVEAMTMLAPMKIVNLTHKATGTIMTVRVTQDMLVEPLARFDDDFPWAEHRAAVEAALFAGDHSVFMRWPEKTDRPA